MWGRASAGLLPGFFLAAALVGLVCWGLPGPWESTLVAGVSAFFPVWTGVFCAGFQFRSGAQSWLWLSALAVAASGLLWWLRSLGWVV
jgi:hypothetical protein